MRILYTFVITLVFGTSLYFVYYVGYQRGKNKQVWIDFRAQTKRDSVNRVNYRAERVHAAMVMYKAGYTWGILEYQIYGQTAWNTFKKDSITARKIIE